VHGMNDRKLHVLRGTQVPESIADHVVEDVSLKSVREHWSALLWISSNSVVLIFNCVQIGIRIRKSLVFGCNEAFVASDLRHN
jgi:hypothetical protein